MCTTKHRQSLLSLIICVTFSATCLLCLLCLQCTMWAHHVIYQLIMIIFIHLQYHSRLPTPKKQKSYHPRHCCCDVQTDKQRCILHACWMAGVVGAVSVYPIQANVQQEERRRRWRTDNQKQKIATERPQSRHGRSVGWRGTIRHSINRANVFLSYFVQARCCMYDQIFNWSCQCFLNLLLTGWRSIANPSGGFAQ